LMHLPGRPAADLRTAMQEDFEQADDARLVDLEPLSTTLSQHSQRR